MHSGVSDECQQLAARSPRSDAPEVQFSDTLVGMEGLRGPVPSGPIKGFCSHRRPDKRGIDAIHGHCEGPPLGRPLERG
jgi:hypothetical protein